MRRSLLVILLVFACSPERKTEPVQPQKAAAAQVMPSTRRVQAMELELLWSKLAATNPNVRVAREWLPVFGVRRMGRLAHLPPAQSEHEIASFCQRVGPCMDAFIRLAYGAMGVNLSLEYTAEELKTAAEKATDRQRERFAEMSRTIRGAIAFSADQVWPGETRFDEFQVPAEWFRIHGFPDEVRRLQRAR